MGVYFMLITMSEVGLLADRIGPDWMEIRRLTDFLRGDPDPRARTSDHPVHPSDALIVLGSRPDYIY